MVNDNTGGKVKGGRRKRRDRVSGFRCQGVTDERQVTRQKIGVRRQNAKSIEWKAEGCKAGIGDWGSGIRAEEEAGTGLKGEEDESGGGL